MYNQHQPIIVLRHLVHALSDPLLQLEKRGQIDLVVGVLPVHEIFPVQEPSRFHRKITGYQFSGHLLGLLLHPKKGLVDSLGRNHGVQIGTEFLSGFEFLDLLADGSGHGVLDPEGGVPS